MHLLIKGYYGYKNLGDELILFPLLTRIETTFHPDQISLLVGDAQRLQQRISHHKSLLPPNITKKLTLLPNPNKREYTLQLLGFGQTYDFYVFGGGQVIDEERPFPHNGRNLPLLYRKAINRGKFALVGGIGTQNKDGTPILQKILLEKAKIVRLRDSFSEGLAERLLKKADWYKIQTVGDMSLSLLDKYKKTFEGNTANASISTKQSKNKRDPYVLINISPLCDFSKAFKKIKNFLRKHPNAQPIYFPAHLGEDMVFFEKLAEHLPPLELFDRTKNDMETIMKLLYYAEAGIGARLHFLYPLKFFGVPYEILVNSHKNQINLADID
jgi:polysaccharide pyruvyl transferase WcaK-like protein